MLLDLKKKIEICLKKGKIGTGHPVAWL